MVDVSRRSNFLPILKDYHSSIRIESNGPSLRPHQWQATAGIRHLMEQTRHNAVSTGAENSQSVQQKKKVKKRVTHKDENSKAATISVDGFKKQYEMEVRRRKNKRLENVLRTWDASLRWDRDQRYQTLQQRVRIQRELITKNDELSDELKKKTEEEYIESVQSRRRAQKEMTEAMRAHIIRVEQHKKKIAEKLKEISQAGSGDQGVHTRDGNEVPGESTNTSVIPRKKPSEVQEKLNDIMSSEDSERTSSSSPLMQILGESEGNVVYSIGDIWGEQRAEAIRRLQPIVRYSHHLKQVASPSVKQFLDIYEKPTPIDRFTGKPIPLGQVLDDIAQATSSAGRHTTMNKAIQVVLNQTEMRANMMLNRRDRYNYFDPSTRCNDGWFILDDSETVDKHMNTEDQDQATIAVDECTIPPDQQQHKTRTTNMQSVKKHLPTYLTPMGDLVSGSLEEFGDYYIACGPSKWKTPTSQDSVFLTDLKVEENEEQVTTNQIRGSNVRVESDTPTKLASRWQPLSTSALAEHKHVSEVPVKGMGHLAHGQYKLWRPNLCVVRVDE